MPRWRSDQGAVTAEFAVALPVIVLVLLLGVGAVAAGTRDVRLEQATAQAARLAARGESDDRVRATVASAASGARVSVVPQGDLVCVSAIAPAAGPLPLPDLSARSCALAGGW